MNACNGIPVMIRKQPRLTPTAAPIATATRRPQTLMAPPEVSLAFIATASSAGSAIVVAKPIANANA